jgi:hypothetical protein
MPNYSSFHFEGIVRASGKDRKWGSLRKAMKACQCSSAVRERKLIRSMFSVAQVVKDSAGHSQHLRPPTVRLCKFL